MYAFCYRATVDIVPSLMTSESHTHHTNVLVNLVVGKGRKLLSNALFEEDNTYRPGLPVLTTGNDDQHGGYRSFAHACKGYISASRRGLGKGYQISR
jgi:hypothetical protein